MNDDWIDPGPDASIELAHPAHPGEVLRDWIDGHKVTVTETARRVGMSRAALNRVLAGKGAMGPRLAVALEEMGWSDASVWMGMQAQWEIARVRRERTAARRIAAPGPHLLAHVAQHGPQVMARAGQAVGGVD